MSGRRPSRGSRIVYREIDSSDEEFDSEDEVQKVSDESNDSDLGDLDSETDRLYQAVFPPLTPQQLQLRQLCRLGDKNSLKTFLVDNPDIDLDVRDPEAGSTALNEAVTKTAQFVDVVDVLLQAGAGLEVTDSLGNTPLHNAVLYYPSTQHTVDLLLDKGSDVTAMNLEGSTPIILADDKDLKHVLKELKKAAGKKKSKAIKSEYSNSPDMRRKVFDRILLEERDKQRIIVKYNSPVVVSSPGLLKRKRDGEELDDSYDCGRRRKRIRWCEQDSTGADIDPQFSDEETEVEDSEDTENTVTDTLSTEICEADIPVLLPKVLSFEEKGLKVINQEKSYDVFMATESLCDNQDLSENQESEKAENSSLFPPSDLYPFTDSSLISSSSPAVEDTSSRQTGCSPVSQAAVISSNSSTISPKLQAHMARKQTSILKFFSQTSSPNAPKIVHI